MSWRFKIACFLLLLLIPFSQIVASVAYPYPVEYTLPDGTTITITLKGDETLKWAMSADRYTLLKNKEGYYEYAVKNTDGYLELSGIRAHDPANRNESETEFLSSIEKELPFSGKQYYGLKSASVISSQQMAKAFPTSGNRKLVCILMNYTDVAFTKSQAEFNNLFNQTNYNTDGATGSVKDFYLENSYNKLNLEVTVVGPYTAANNMAYYGANDADDDDERPRELIEEAINLANPDIDFADFDNDGNGNVDGIYVIFAGYGEEAGASDDAIWSHAWSINTQTLDGVNISDYSTSPELRRNSGSGITRIGVICHEFGHTLGAPDYYDTNYETGGDYEGTGDWDLMASGSWNDGGATPAHHNAYTKSVVYNWVSPTVLNSRTTISMPKSITNTSSFFKIRTNTNNEYFLLENRQKTGFDSYIPGHGLVIYHVASNISSYNINTTHPQKMYTVCASASSDAVEGSSPSHYGTINSAGCSFPGTSNVTSFTDNTTPSMRSWALEDTEKPITNIAESGSGVITFDFMGGATDEPTNFVATTVSDSEIQLNWDQSDGRDVLLAYNTTNYFGIPVNGTSYQAGEDSGGGGKVLGIISGSEYSHTGLSGNTTYYYKVWTITDATPSYSEGVEANSTTDCGVSTIPFTETFDNQELPGCWSVVDYDGNGQIWEFGTLTTATSGLQDSGNYAYLDSDNYGEGNRQNTDLITPAINFTGKDDVMVSFDHIYKSYQQESETASFYYSTDGTNWVLLQQWTETIDEQRNEKFILTGLENEASIWFKWNYQGEWGYWWCIDNFSIEETQDGDAIAQFSADAVMVNIGETVTFTDESLGYPNQWQWELGDHAFNGSRDGAGPHEVVYYKAGKKTVSLSTGNDELTKNNYINVINPYGASLIVSWDFEDDNLVADDGLEVNLTKTITTNSTGNINYYFDESSFVGSTGWDDGNGEKYWAAEFSTEGYQSLTVSSRQGGNGDGPQNFKLQYSLDGTNWNDVSNSDLILEHGLEKGVLSNLSLPDECDNQASVHLRWIMNSNKNVSGTTVIPGGLSYITNIEIEGTATSSIPDLTVTTCMIGEGTITPAEGESTAKSHTLFTFSAASTENWTFEKWTIDGTDYFEEEVQLLITENTDAEAVFNPVPYTLSLAKTGEGETTPAVGDHVYDYGETITITATPTEDWRFLKWQAGIQEYDQNPLDVQLLSDTLFTAIFEEIPQYTLDVSSDGNGSTTPSTGNYTYFEGTTVSLIAEADYHWEFEKWIINGDEINEAAINIAMDANTTTTAYFIEFPQYPVTIGYSGSGATDPEEGEYSYYQGDAVQLNVNLETGWQFQKWIINEEEILIENPEIIITEEVSATAYFELIPCTITIAKEGNGTTTPTIGDHVYNYGETVELTASPDAGWNFGYWQIGEEIITENTTQVVLTSDTLATAVFTEIPKFDITISLEGNGSTTPVPGTYTHLIGESISLSAIADPLWEFEKWLINGTTFYQSSVFFYIKKNTTAHAVFKEIPQYTLSVYSVGSGTPEPVTGDYSYYRDETVQLNANPETGWQFQKWLINEEEVFIENPEIVITENTNATVYFELIPYTLTVAAEGNGTTNPAIGNHVYNYGENISITATPDTGWDFSFWQIGNATINENTTNIILTSDTLATAVFTEIPKFTLDVSKEGNGTTSPVTGSYVYYLGETIELTAVPDEGWQFVEWQIGDETTTTSSTEVIITSDTMAKAIFTEIPRFNLEISVEGNGTTNPIVGTYNYQEGETVTLTAEPAEEWRFLKWQVGYSDFSEKIIEITINSDTTAIAHFEEIPRYNVTISYVGEGTIDPESGTYTYLEGESLKLTASANGGWKFDNWMINETAITDTMTTTTVYSDINAVANFSVDTGIDKLDKELKVFPVPFRDELKISATSLIRSVKIEDITGRTVYQSGTLEVYNVNVDTRSFVPGLYLISINGKNSRFVKAVKN